MESTTMCATCYALVHEDYYENHQNWHEDIRDFINSQSRGWS